MILLIAEPIFFPLCFWYSVRDLKREFRERCESPLLNKRNGLDQMGLPLDRTHLARCFREEPNHQVRDPPCLSAKGRPAGYFTSRAGRSRKASGHAEKFS
jgi:hypothetical protein